MVAKVLPGNAVNWLLSGKLLGEETELTMAYIGRLRSRASTLNDILVTGSKLDDPHTYLLIDLLFFFEPKKPCMNTMGLFRGPASGGSWRSYARSTTSRPEAKHLVCGLI
jgi:hypothetical protein